MSKSDLYRCFNIDRFNLGYLWHMDRFRPFLYLAIITCVLVIPVFSVTYLPLVDWPNHLARAYILSSYDRTPIFSETFSISFEPIPNLACDIIMQTLMRFIGPNEAGKLFVCIIIAVFVIGCFLTVDAKCRSYPTIFICSSLIYSSNFLWGFINYILGVGVYLIALWYWRNTGKNGINLLSVLKLSVLVSFCYLSHLTSFALMGASAVFLSIGDIARNRAIWKICLVKFISFLPGTLLFLGYMRESGRVGVIEWGSFAEKFNVMISPFLAYNHVLDAILVTSGLVFLIYNYVKKNLRVWSSQQFALSGILAAITLVSPTALLTASAVDSRFILPAAVLFLSSLKFELKHRIEKLALAFVLFISILRLGLLTDSWKNFDYVIAREVKTFNLIEDGARIIPVIGLSDKKELRQYNHLIHYATIERNAVVASLFASVGQQPIRFREAPPRINEQTVANVCNEGFDEYGFLWGYNLNENSISVIEQCAVSLSSFERFRLWKRPN